MFGVVLNMEGQEPYAGLAQLPAAAFLTTVVHVIHRLLARTTDDAWM